MCPCNLCSCHRVQSRGLLELGVNIDVLNDYMMIILMIPPESLLNLDRVQSTREFIECTHIMLCFILWRYNCLIRLAHDQKSMYTGSYPMAYQNHPDKNTNFTKCEYVVQVIFSKLVSIF